VKEGDETKLSEHLKANKIGNTIQISVGIDDEY
jgi:hypothetical protein